MAVKEGTDGVEGVEENTIGLGVMVIASVGGPGGLGL